MQSTVTPSPDAPSAPPSRMLVTGAAVCALPDPCFPLTIPPAPKSRMALHPLRRCLLAEEDVRLGTRGIDPSFESAIFRVLVYAAYGVYHWTEDSALYAAERAARLLDDGMAPERAERLAIRLARAWATASVTCGGCDHFKLLREGRGICHVHERLVAMAGLCASYAASPRH